MGGQSEKNAVSIVPVHLIERTTIPPSRANRGARDQPHHGTPRPPGGPTYLGVRHELIFDPDTSAILGERQVQVDPPVNNASPLPDVGVNADGVSDPGTVLGWSSVVASGVVDSTQERL